jgi:protoporphyrinogen oxidase
MGLAVGHRLAREGHRVEVHEAGPYLGGLAAATEIAGRKVDRYYHVILAADHHLMHVFDELEIKERMRWGTTKMAFWHEGKLFPMSTVKEFFTFPPLSMIDRVRLAWTLAMAKMTRDWRTLDGVSLEEWLTRLSGKRTYEHIWRPLIASKFDGEANRVPATYMWSRIHRMTSTRKGARQTEAMGHLEGGYETLAVALARSIRQRGGQVHLDSPVQCIVAKDGRAAGLRFAAGEQEFDAVVATVADPILSRLVPSEMNGWAAELAAAPYLGIACLTLVLDRRLSEYYSINLTDRSVPLTGIIETTTLIDPALVGDGHLVYLPKYCSGDSDYLTRGEDEITAEFLGHLKRVFPDFDESWILGSKFSRTRWVEPIHEIEDDRVLPATESALPGLFVTNTRRIYPALHNCEATVGQAELACKDILASL